MNQILTQSYKTPYGELILGAFNNKLCLCDWRYRKMRTAIDHRLIKYLEAPFVEKESEVVHTTQKELDEYFESKREIFDIPLLMAGSEFQKSVWQELRKIPFGTTATYLGLAKKMGNKKAIRAVAAANGANAISIIIPCHRIIGSNGGLVGYAGGLRAKEKLLQLERHLFNM